MIPRVGQEAKLSKAAKAEDIDSFSYLTGDMNPVHVNEDFAGKTRFGRRIAHGMWVASLISAVIGTKLPGPGSIYLGQSLEFTEPVFIGDTVTATAKVIDVREDKPIVTLETICRNQHGNEVIRGEAVVFVEDVG